MGIDDLIRQFRETAKEAGTVFTLAQTPEKAKQTPERKQLVAKMRALSAELIARNAITEIRAMLEDDDRDIRGWAAGQFSQFDPLWASAAFSGLLAHLTTRDVLALI
jgi:hypothetical protein